MPNMTGRPGHRTMEINGGNSAAYLARTPCAPLFCTCLVGVETEGRFRLPGWAGIISLYGGSFARSYLVSIKPEPDPELEPEPEPELPPLPHPNPNPNPLV